MERQPRRQAGRFALVGAVVLSAFGLVAIGSEPAAAAVTSISPSVVTVEPGGSASATVRVEAPGFTCLSVHEDPGVSASVLPKCNDEASWTARLSVTSDGPVGDFRVRVNDDEFGGSQSLLVRVREPEPPPPPTTTTTRPATTTTRRTTTTTEAPTTTEPPTTTEAPTTTVAPTETIPPDAFVPIATLIERPLPTEGVFVPLVDPAYRRCLPLTEPCGDVEAGLLFLPARSTEVHWLTVEGTELPAPRSNLRALPPLRPVGVAPAEPAAQHYGLAVLDLTAPGGQMRTLVRALDSTGSFVAPADDLAVATAELSGFDPSSLSGTAGSSMPFGRPDVVGSHSLTEAAQVVVVFTSAQAQVLYGVRADPAWGLNHELVPILNGESLPYLVRGVDGPPGLFVPRPDGLRVPAAPEPEDAISAERAEDEDDGGLPLWLIGVNALAGAVAIIGAVAIVLRRRRRRAAVDDVADEISTTPGT